MSVKVHDKIYHLRQDVENLQVEGLAGKLLIGWWLYPVKNLVAEPLLGIAESVVPSITAVVPLSDHVVGLGLDATIAVGHLVHAVGSTMGVLQKEPKHQEAVEEPIQAASNFEMDRFLNETANMINTTIGFGTGVVVDLLTTATNTEKLSGWVKTVLNLNEYLARSGIYKDLSAVGPDFVQRMIILGRAQAKTRAIYSNNAPTREDMETGYYYMKFATAAYGLSTIKAANYQKAAAGFRRSAKKRLSIIAEAVTGKKHENGNNGHPNPTLVYGNIDGETALKYFVDDPIEEENLKQISQHIGVAKEDIVMYVTPGGGMDVLRHFIAVDRTKKAVVLAIRGTFSVSEILVDCDGDTSDFYGGQAHSGIADQAEKLWDCAGGIVKNALEENPGYNFVITGHSLGAGTACLLTIKLYAQRLAKSLMNRKILCYAFASPAVFSNLQAAPEAVASTTNFIHDDDCVSFLSLSNVRELLESLDAVGKNSGSFMDQLQVMLGKKDPSPEVLAAVDRTQRTKRSSIKGAATSYVPAETVIWMRGSTDDGYNAYLYDPTELPEIFVDVDMLTDHFPPYYEEALKKLSSTL